MLTSNQLNCLVSDISNINVCALDKLREICRDVGALEPDRPAA